MDEGESSRNTKAVEATLEKEICLIDYGVGNLGAIVSLLTSAGVRVCVTNDKNQILDSKVVLLAGVGSFDFGMKRLEDSGIADVLRQKVEYLDQKILGICLGMQLLFERSEEGKLPGLGIVRGEVSRFPRIFEGREMLVPHMGWSPLIPTSNETNLFSRFHGHRFYFVHSYFVSPDDYSTVILEANYGRTFPAILRSRNILAAQFHPEKSGRQGKALLLEMLGGQIGN